MLAVMLASSAFIALAATPVEAVSKSYKYKNHPTRQHSALYR